MSGLTVGLLSIDQVSLEISKLEGNEEDRERAERIMSTLSNHHWLLVTLLLCNAAALETLPIFLGKMVPEHIAIIISVTAVLFFGEIIPQAICIGPV